VLGRVEPRISTPPLRDLEVEDASWGWDFADFCALIGYPLDEWQAWLAIHLGELLEDGSPRFRKAIVVVARQNGKSLFAALLCLYWLFVERVPLVYGTHKDRAEAKKAWREAIEIAESTPLLAAALPPVHIVKQISEEDFFTSFGSHYLFGAPNRRAGRGRTVHRALIDELREHTSRDCWNALVPATNAVGNPLVLAITNEGPMESTVLHEEMDSALGYIETGEGDWRTFLAAWSCPSDADPLDLEALAYANPSLGRIRPNGTGLRADALLGLAHTAVKAGGKTLADFKTEMMCIRVDQLDAAIRPEDWAQCGVQRADALDLAQHRREVALAFDVAADASHATLVAAVTVDGVTHLDVVKSWDGFESRKQLRAELPGLVEKIRPRKVCWLAGGPAAAVADEFHARRLRNVLVEVVRAEDIMKAVMGFEEQAAAGHLRHAHDPLLNQHVQQAQRLARGDGWVFARRGQAPIDAVYAAAAATHAARTIIKLGPAV
jgi:phage terminase large subunit-like protein